jgi:hypothetical protein
VVVPRRPVDVSRRAPRRFPRLILLALVLSVVVVAVNSILTTSSEGIDQSVAYADRVRPAVERSTRQAAAVDDLRNQAGQLQAAALRRALERLAREAKQLEGQVRAVDPPSEVTIGHGLLVTSLATRAAAIEGVKAALTADVNTPLDEAITSLEKAGQDLVVSDRAYQLFLDELPESARSTMPPSIWVNDATRWARPEMAALASTVRASGSVAPVNDVALVTVTPDPRPVAAEADGRQVLPRSKNIRLDVVVANAGNTQARRVAVEAVLTMEGGLDTARQFVDIAPGQRQAVTLNLRVPAGPEASIVVRVGPVAGEDRVSDNEQTLNYVIR